MNSVKSFIRIQFMITSANHIHKHMNTPIFSDLENAVKSTNQKKHTIIYRLIEESVLCLAFSYNRIFIYKKRSFDWAS